MVWHLSCDGFSLIMFNNHISNAEVRVVDLLAVCCVWYQIPVFVCLFRFSFFFSGVIGM